MRLYQAEKTNQIALAPDSNSFALRFILLAAGLRDLGFTFFPCHCKPKMPANLSLKWQTAQYSSRKFQRAEICELNRMKACKRGWSFPQVAQTFTELIAVKRVKKFSCFHLAVHLVSRYYPNSYQYLLNFHPKLPQLHLCSQQLLCGIVAPVLKFSLGHHGAFWFFFA